MLAQRTALLNSSGDAAAWSPANACATNADPVIDLTADEIWSDFAPMVREGAIVAINRYLGRNTDAACLMELRHALARKISAETALDWSADEIAVTSGCEQALFNAAMVLLNPGDEVLIPAPYSTLFPTQIALAGGTPIFIGTWDNNYVPKLADLAAAVTPKTKAIVVNTPNNPTGTVYNRATLADIAQLAIDRDLWIIFDECYGAFVHAPHTHHPIVSADARARSRTLTVNSFCKSLALTGWRIGYLAGPESVIRAVNRLQIRTTSNPSTIGQRALLHHIESGDVAFQQKLQRQVDDARKLGLSILSTLTSIPAPAAQGGFHFYLDLSPWQRHVKARGRELNADEVVNVLLMEAGVATVSGTAFGDPAGVRVSYGIDLELMDKGLRRLAATLNSWK